MARVYSVTYKTGQRGPEPSERVKRRELLSSRLQAREAMAFMGEAPRAAWEPSGGAFSGEAQGRSRPGHVRVSDSRSEEMTISRLFSRYYAFIVYHFAKSVHVIPTYRSRNDGNTAQHDAPLPSAHSRVTVFFPPKKRKEEEEEGGNPRAIRSALCSGCQRAVRSTGVCRHMQCEGGASFQSGQVGPSDWLCRSLFRGDTILSSTEGSDPGQPPSRTLHICFASRVSLARSIAGSVSIADYCALG